MADSIKRFQYERLRNEAHVQLHENFISLVKNHNAEEIGISAMFEQYIPLFETEKSALDVIAKSGLTDEIMMLDRKRDDLVRGFTYAVKSALNHYDEEKKNAAEKINLILTHYGDIANRPMDQETAAIDDMNRELEDKQNIELLSVLGLEEWRKHIVEANRAFDETMMARYKEKAERTTVNMRSARIDVDKAFRSMLDLIDALVLVNGNEKYAAFIAELNAVMERYEHIIRQKKGARAKKAKEKGEDAKDGE